jgi:lysophospholipase L1-like esterase
VAAISFDARRLGGGAVVALGLLVLLSALWLNPVVAGLLRGPRALDYADVLAGYFWSACVTGVTLLALGRRVMRGKSRADELALLAIVLSAAVLFDRYLLTRFGLTLWTHDAEVHYRHRPNAVRTLASVGRPGERIVINRWGFHDTDFPLQKPAREFRALMLGDSITMGFGLTYAETFSAQLEKLLGPRDRKFASHQVINAGVHGYSTFHEKHVLVRSLKFAPDIVFVGFCMNDVTEPFVVDAQYGGTGIDYHGVSQTPNALAGWIASETGLGRLLQVLGARGKTLQYERRLEIYNVRAMAAESRTSPKMQEAWRILLKQLDELYGIAAQQRVPVVLVIFPYTFQLADESLRAPQEILARHAAAHGVDVIDTTPDFARLVFDDPQLVEFLRRKGKTRDEILAYHQHLASRYFLDENHLTDAGHRIVAQRLLDYLLRRALVGEPGG